MTECRNDLNDHHFSELIDCRFPYGDEREWKRLVDLGRSISPNAHFVSLREISHLPASATVTAAEQREMVRYWSAGFEHPLKEAILECAVARIERRYLSVEHVLRLMDEIARDHKGQWGALVIALQACNDEDDVADERFNAIKLDWRYDG
jgi:hypothetical protein